MIDASATMTNRRQPSSPTAVREADMWLLRDALSKYGDLLASLGVSLSEAAWRGHNSAVDVHVKQARLVVIDALDAAKKLAALDAESGAA